MWYGIFNILIIYTIIINIITIPVIFWIYANDDYLEKTGEKDDKIENIDIIVATILLANPIVEMILFYTYIKDNYT